MNDQNKTGSRSEFPGRRKSPINPALASAILATLTFLVFTFGSTASETASAILPVVPVLAVFAAGALAYTVLIKPSYALLSSLLSVVAVLISAYLFKIELAGTVTFLAVPSLTALISGTVMGICTKKRAGMTSTVILSAAIPAVLLCAAVLIHSLIVTGSPTETLRVIIAQVREETVAIINESLLQMKETLEYDLMQINAESIVSEAFNVLPGTLVASAAVLSFCAWKAMLFTAKIFGIPSDIPEESRKFEISIEAAIIYIVSLVLTVLSGGGIINASAHNIAICLVPGLAYSGAGSYLAERKNGVVRIGCLPLMIFLFLLYMNPSLAFKVLALFGAFDVIGKRLGKNK